MRRRRKKRNSWIGVVSIFVGGAAGVYIGISLLWFLTNEDPTNLISQIKQDGVQNTGQETTEQTPPGTARTHTGERSKSGPTAGTKKTTRQNQAPGSQDGDQNRSLNEVAAQATPSDNEKLESVLTPAESSEGASAKTEAPKAEVPTQEAQAWARESASEIFQERYKTARTSLAKLKIARELLALADETESDNATKYVLHDIALDIAINEQALDLIEAITLELLAKFRVDEENLRRTTWSKLIKSKEHSEQEQDRLLKEILSRSALHLKSVNPAAAVILTEIALSDLPFLVPNETSAELQLLNQTATITNEKLAAALAASSGQPSPKSLTASGSTHCFILNQWKQGLAKIAGGDDTTLAGIASEEISLDTADPKALHQVAVAWQQYANSISGDPTLVLQKSTIRNHALELELIAKPIAAGLILLTIEKSIEELETKLTAKTWIDSLILPEHQAHEVLGTNQWAVAGATNDTQVTITNSIGQNFSLIPAHRSLRVRGSTTNIRRFWIATHEVTESQWFEVMGKDWQKSSSGFASFGSAGARKDYPITDISYQDALLFCDTLNQLPEERRSRRKYRVPTVNEWVAACLGNATTTYSFGEAPDEAFQYAWTDRELHAVGQRKPNDFGLYDCYNNAMELCVDVSSTSPIYNGENITIAGRCLFDDDLNLEKDHGISFQSLGQFSDSAVKNTGLRLVLEN